MKTTITALLAVAALSGGLAGCHPYYGDARVHDRDYDVRVAFTDHDRVVIRDYYRDYDRSLPPGLAKKGKVPPGHAYKLQRNQGVPRDVAWQHLPPDVERRLSRLPEGYARIVIGADAAIMNTRTRVVVDVLEGLHD
ncbi:MAG: hypothetical protein ROZ09_00965 [Thiobacillus sp.]|jgi:hypothetical protein|uniref:hypothetical protein n=1 Tax=Thiobacillus sp. TaxID=924 RepID=UPI00289538B0|nr:hypothetical protein [Thiobacillus sp.]MDT3705365.1 hypothetical protein [Thiobacillus sp.]